MALTSAGQVRSWSDDEGGVAAAPLQFSGTLKIHLQLSGFFFWRTRWSSSFLSKRKKEIIFSS